MSRLSPKRLARDIAIARSRPGHYQQVSALPLFIINFPYTDEELRQRERMRWVLRNIK